jgi:hypothetical protein
MIHFLNHDYIPSCQEILTVDPLFKGSSQYHGREVDPYASDSICKKWMNLQKRYVCAPFEMERVCFTRKITHHAKFHGLKSGVQ